ncbi:dihydrofolate reductase family protein [Leisingera sp. JC11]|uniref:dihydrofolate reductase family protein n=1 Tax=Leisingera sp. JC11 TaxID=3042469 RepID=UPI0034550BC5
MREIAVLSFLTLDGVVQGPMHAQEDRSGGFAQGGWAAPYLGGVMPRVFDEWMQGPVSFLFGRKTYEAFAAHWPAISGDPMADLLNGAEKYVASRTLNDAGWQNSRVLKGDAVTEVQRLKEQEGPRLQVHGSGELIAALLAQGLVDELRLAIFPRVLGAGRRLFGAGTPPSGWALKQASATGNGVQMNLYRRA